MKKSKLKFAAIVLSLLSSLGAQIVTNPPKSGGSAPIAAYTLCSSGCSTTVPASGTTITAATHGQGPFAQLTCFDGASPPNLVATGSENSNPTGNGNVTIVYSVAPSSCAIYTPGGGGVAGPTGAAGPINTVGVNGSSQPVEARLNLKSGTNITVAAADNPGSGSTDVTVSIPASPTFTGTVTVPTPFTLGATSVTSTGTQLNLLNAATGTTGTTSTNLVFSTSPTLVTPALGTPTALVLTSATGLPLTTGVTGVLPGANGGTGIANTGKTITLAGNLTTTGAFNTTLAQSGTITETLPSTSFSTARIDAAQTFTGNQSFAGTFPLYNNIATVANGIPAVYGQSDLTAQTAAQTTAALYTPTATGMFRVSYYAKVTTAGTSSILGGTTGFVLNYTDGTDSVAQNLTLTEANQSGTILSIGTGNVTNTTAAIVYGTAMVYAKTGVAMTYNFGYSSTGTVMQYEVHVKLEQL